MKSQFQTAISVGCQTRHTKAVLHPLHPGHQPSQDPGQKDGRQPGDLLQQDQVADEGVLQAAEGRRRGQGED